MQTEIFNRLKAFTIKQAAVEEEEVTENASIQNDLGVYGDDAVEFIIAFGKEFNVDVSNFMSAEYFRPEGDVILPALIRVFTERRRPRLKSLTIEHLKKAVMAGRLDEEIIIN
jgi:acyl carrier protein